MTLDMAPLFGLSPSCRLQIWHTFQRNFTVLLITHAFIHEWNKPYLLLPSAFPDPLEMESWAGLGTTMVSRQSPRTVMWRKSQLIAAQTVTPQWVTRAQRLEVSNSRPLGPKDATLTTKPPSHPQLMLILLPVWANSLVLNIYHQKY